MDKGKLSMKQLLPLFEKAEANGGMTSEIQQEIFHSLAKNFSCIPLVGTKFKKAKKPKPEAAGWKKWCDENPDKKLELSDYDTNMIGLCTIPYNHIIVLDVDNVEIFQEVIDYFNLPLPDTTLVQTGKGYHYYLYRDDSQNYSDRSKKFIGFDIKAQTYVVAPGSSHPNGNYYKLINCIYPFTVAPQWIKKVSTGKGFINTVLCGLNNIRSKEIQEAEKKNQIPPKFDIEKLVAQFLEQNPNYEPLFHQFPGYKKQQEMNMSQSKKSCNPFEIKSTLTPPQSPVSVISTDTQNLLTQSPPQGQRSELINSAILMLKNAGYTDELVAQIMSTVPLGGKLRERGDQFTYREIASANNFIKTNPPKKPKIDVGYEAYNIMLQMNYVKSSDGELYCKIIHSPSNTEFIPVKSDSFYGIICKLFLQQFKKTISTTQYKPLLTALIEEKRKTAPIVPTMNRFYQEKSRLIYDMGKEDYQCIEITPNKVVQIPQPDMILERSDLSRPVENIDLTSNSISVMDNFWDICGISDVYKRHYLNILILSYLFEKINSPILYLYGQHGSGKTHLALAIKNIFDPLEAGAVPPTKEDNFRLFLSQSGVGFMDNFTRLPKDFLNDLCNSYSGGIVFNRQLFSDKKGIKYSIRCPMILATVIIPPKLPEDFISRTVFLKINPKRNLITEKELQDKLNKLNPQIRGLFFNLASQILPIMNNYKPTNLTRHADLDTIGQAYCDLVSCPLSYVNICQQISIDSAFAVIDDEPSIRNFIKIVYERKFITFTMSEMSTIIFEDLKLDSRISEAKLGRDLLHYTPLLHQLHIKFYYGIKLSPGGKPCVAFIDDGKSIPEDIDSYKLSISPEYVTEVYCRYHKTETGQVLDDLLK